MRNRILSGERENGHPVNMSFQLPHGLPGLAPLHAHHFIKKTQKTPAREIQQEKRALADLKERGIYDE